MLTDLRFALRYFARHRAATILIATVIALGTGANAVIFSIFQAQFLRPAPGLAKDDALTRIWAQERASRTGSLAPREFSLPELNTLAARRDVFRDVAAWTEDDVILGGDSMPARSVGAQFVTPNYFAALGIGVSGGRGFGGDQLSAVLSQPAAEVLYGSVTAAVGRRILVNEVPVYIVGVAPARFQGAMRDMRKPGIWMPLSARSEIAHVPPRWSSDESRLAVFARLAPGASREQATALTRQTIANTLPDSAARLGMSRTAQALSMQSPAPGDASANEAVAFTIMLSIGVLILLVACMNVSALMVASAVSRRHEIAVRMSLGASRARLLRQMVTESTLLASIGSAAGLMLAWWALTFMSKSDANGVDLAPDLGTFVFVLGMAITTGILFGLAPALNATRGAVASAVRGSGSGSRSRSRLQRGFVIAQIALSQPLLVLLATMLLLVLADYRPLSPTTSRHVIAVDIHPLDNGGPGQRSDAVRTLLPRIAEHAEVLSAVPDAAGLEIRGVVALDARADSTGLRIVNVEGAAPGWLSLMDVPVVHGRDVSLVDTAASGYPIVIGSDLAHSLWGDANPIGRTLTSRGLPGLNADSVTMTVVGVYDAMRRLPGMSWSGSAVRGSMSASVTRIFTARGGHWRQDRMLVRTRSDAERYLPELQRVVRDAAPSLPVTSMLTLAQADAQEYRVTLRSAAMAGGAGMLALLLASLGLYGVVSLAVRQRTREIGIRIAVGAAPIEVARMFLASGVRVSLVAMAIGLPLSVAALKVGMSTGAVIAPSVNPYVIGLVLAPVLVAVAAAATWMPARRAALVDPARTLRVE